MNTGQFRMGITTRSSPERPSPLFVYEQTKALIQTPTANQKKVFEQRGECGLTGALSGAQQN